MKKNEVGQERRDTLSIIVPTYNRPLFLLRLLRYYESCGAPFPLHIVDSSHPAAEDPRFIQLCESTHAEYTRYDPGTLPTPKIADALRRVTTPYVVLWADDDLMVPRGLAAGLMFLEEHPDYSVAHGHSGLFQTGMDQEGRQVVLGISFYRQRSYADATASQRVTACLMDYTNLFYSVHRTAQLRENVDQCLSFKVGTAAFSRDDWWVELALACLSVVRGKASQLSGLYMLRHRHAGADSWEADGAKLDLFEWVTSPSFSEAYRAFAGCLVEAVARQDGLTSSQAHDVIKQAFWFHLAKNLTVKWHARYETKQSAHLRAREAARRIPGLRTAWRRAQSLLPHRPGALSLPALLQPSSRYHEDFMPIYRAIMAAGEPERAEPGFADAVPVEQHARA